MNSVTVSVNGADGTAGLATRLAPHLRPSDVILLKGGLGAGKTTFVKALAAAMGSSEVVTSPTFTLAQFYPLDRGTVLHIDVYRLASVPEFRDLGLEEYFDEAVTLIEWGDKVEGEFPGHLLLDFARDPAAPDLRVIAISAQSPRWLPVIESLQSSLLDDANFG